MAFALQNSDVVCRQKRGLKRDVRGRRNSVSCPSKGAAPTFPGLSINAPGLWGWQPSQPSPWSQGMRNLSLGSAGGPSSTGAWQQAGRNILQKPEEAAGGNLEDVFCKVWGWMGGQRVAPPSAGKRGDDPTKGAAKSSHSGGSGMSTAPWDGTQDYLALKSACRKHFSCCCCAWAQWGSWWGRTFQKKN